MKGFLVTAENMICGAKIYGVVQIHADIMRKLYCADGLKWVKKQKI